MFWLIQQVFIVLFIFSKSLANIFNAPDHTKCISLNNQQWRLNLLIDLHPNKQVQWLHYYPFAINLDRWMRSCNTLNDLSRRICVPNQTEDLNLSVFNMETGINESKIL